MAIPTTRRFNKAPIIGALVASLLVGGYLAMSRATPAPEVTFIDLKGQKVSTQALRGKVVMVNFWATSCVTCVKEMPQMVDTYNKYKAQGLEFVAVAMQYDRADYVLNFTQTRKLPFTVALDTAGDIAKSFGDVTLTPTTFVIDKDGNIIKRYVGEPKFTDLHKLLEKELAG